MNNGYSRYSPYSKSTYNRSRTNTAKRAKSRVSARFSTKRLIKKTLMNMTETKAINGITDYLDLYHNKIPAAAIDVKPVVTGQTLRNLTFSTLGDDSKSRDGASIYAKGIDMNIHIQVPDNYAFAEATRWYTDNFMGRLVVYEVDHSLAYDVAETVEKKLFTPLNLVADANLLLTELNHTDFRILSDTMINSNNTAMTITGGNVNGGYQHVGPHQIVVKKSISLNKNVTYVDAHTPNKKVGMVFIGYSGKNMLNTDLIGKYRVSWKFTWKDI